MSDQGHTNRCFSSPHRGTILALLPLLVLLVVAAPALCEEEGKEPAAPAAVAGVERADEPAAESEKGKADDLGWAIEGYLRSELRFRHIQGDDDLDLRVHLLTDLTHRGERTIRARVNARLNWDISGDQAPNDLLWDVWDGFQGDAQVRLYEAFVEVDRLLGGAAKLLAGRQFIDEGVYLHFDGARVDLDLGEWVENLDVTGFFGGPVRFGETSRSENWLAGMVARYRLSRETRLRLEYYHISEAFEGFNDPITDPLLQPVSEPSRRVKDDLFGISVWHRVSKALRVFGRFTILESDPNELELRARWLSEDGAWTVVLDVYQLFSRLRNVTNDLTPYVPMLGSYEPFLRIGARATYRLDEFWIFQGGFSHRELQDELDEGTFNHEFNHYFASVTRLGLADERLDITLTANGYNSSRNDVLAIGGHGNYLIDAQWTISGGIDYSLFKYDFLLNTEHEDVWTYSAELRWKRTKDMTIRGKIAVDDDRLETYVTLTVSVRVRF